MHRIKNVSFYFRIFFQVFFIATLLVQIIGWIYAPQPLGLFFGSLNVIPPVYQNHIPSVLSFDTKLYAFLLSSVPLIIDLLSLYFLIKLFRLFEKGEIFSLQNIHFIRNIGYALLANQVVNPFYQFFMGFILTRNNPPGQRFAAIHLVQTNIGMILIGFIVILISWIITEAYKLREEQRLTV